MMMRIGKGNFQWMMVDAIEVTIFSNFLSSNFFDCNFQWVMVGAAFPIVKYIAAAQITLHTSFVKR